MQEQKEQSGLTPFREHVLTAQAYLLCTPSGRVRYASGPLKLMIEEDLSGRNLNDFLEDAIAARLIAETLAGGAYAFRCDIRGQAFNCRAEPWEDGEGIQVALFPVNAGQVKTASSGLSRFMTQEIDRELSVLLPAVQLLEDSALPRQEAPLAVLKLHLYRLLRLSRNVEELAMVEKSGVQLHYSEVDLTAFCRELLEKVAPYCAAWGIALRCRLPEEPLCCRMDQDRVRGMLLHLLRSAISAQKEGGAISVTLQPRDNGDISLSVAHPGDGILGEEGRAAKRGDLLNPDGLDLDLELTRAFIQAHGGQMILMGNETGGLVANITLPRGEQTPLDQLHAWRAAYGAGIDPVLVELSPVATKEMFLKKGRPPGP